MLSKSCGKRIVTIDGDKISSYSDYIETIEKQLSFPRKCGGSIDRYLDWMRDLDWIKEETITIVVRNASNLMKNEECKMIIGDIQNYIIPFWLSDYKTCIVDGNPRRIVLVLK